jgi:hypothetical protein
MQKLQQLLPMRVKGMLLLGLCLQAWWGWCRRVVHWWSTCRVSGRSCHCLVLMSGCTAPVMMAL